MKGDSDAIARRLAASIDELERQRASVLKLNALKNDLIAVLAHDIKGPLTSIAGFAELLEEGVLEGPAAADAAKTIRTNAQRLAQLANDVLALSRIEHGELDISDEHVDLVEMLRDLAQREGNEREVRFTTALDRALVRGDNARLRQAFDNLLRNAIKYSPGGEPVEIALEANGENFAVAVRDRGMGIPEEDVPKLFGRFARASNARRAKIAGTGLGLFIVRMIVERHGGTVAVRSKVGEGSTFTVTLPSLGASVSQRPMRVAIVTGDADVRRFAAYELRTRGYRVRECATLDDLSHLGDLRPGDVVLADPAVASGAEIRKFAAPGSIRVVGLGAKRGPEWDEVLERPFLATDLLTAVSS